MAEKAEALSAIRTVNNWINNELVAATSGDSLAVHDSATGEQCATVAVSNQADVDKAIAAAKAAFPAWSRTSVLKRARVMFKFKELVEKIGQELHLTICQG